MLRFIRQRYRIILLSLAGLLAVGLTVGFMLIRKGDAKHAVFVEGGSTIKAFLAEYSAALKSEKKGETALEDFFHADFKAEGRGDWVLGEWEILGGAHVAKLGTSGSATYDNAGILKAHRDYLGGLSKVTRIKCKIDLIDELVPFKRANLTVKFILDGYDQEGRHLQDRHFYRWQLENIAETPDYYDWRIVSDALVDGVRTMQVNTVFVAQDVAALGVDYKHQRDPKLDRKQHQLKFAVIQHAMGGLSTADFNGDHKPDLFFADGIRSRLYRNDSEGEALRFTDVTAELGLDGIDQATFGNFADFDNDGDMDLLVTRYDAPNYYYERQEDGFVERGAELGLDVTAPTITATFLDFDRDGRLDIYLGVNGNAFEELPRLPFFGRNAKPNRLLRNTENGFVDVTEASGTGDTGWTLAVAAGDYNGDGYTDLATANDFGRKVLFMNKGDGTFEDRAREAGTLDFSGGMGILFADFNNDKLADIYTSNIKSNTRWFGQDITLNQYMRNVVRTKYLFTDMSEYMELYRLLGNDWRRLGYEVGEGNSLFYNNGDETFTEMKDSNTHQAGWGWSIAAFDYDNDTDLDIYAVNGWITNTPDTDL